MENFEPATKHFSRLFIKISLTIFFCNLFFLGYSQSQYYVSTTGINSNPGTDALPWKNIQYACDRAKPGDVIWIKGGTYKEKITIKTSGTATASITLQNFQNQNVIVDGAGISGASLINIYNKSYIRIIGLNLMNNTAGDPPAGIMISGSGSDILIKNCKISGIVSSNDAHGLAVYGTNGSIPYKNIVIDGNEIFNCKLGTSESLVLNGNVTDFQIINNKVHDNNNIGIDMIGFEGTAPSNDQVRNGICKGNHVYNISTLNNPSYNSLSSGGIYVDGGKNIIIENNITHHNDIGIEVASEHNGKVTDGVTVRNNLIFSNNMTGIAFGGYDSQRGWAANCKFLNNTLYKNDTRNTGSGEIMIQKSRDNIVRNNIIYTNSRNVAVSNYFSSANSYNNSFNYNLYFNEGGINALVFSWQNRYLTGFSNFRNTTGQDLNSNHNNPGFINASANDFHISSTSPAINSGDPSFIASPSETDLDKKVRVQGGRVDIGAYEFNSEVNNQAVTTLYQHCNYGGYLVGLPVGQYTLSQLITRGLKDNDMSSLKITAGYKVTLYELDNFAGRVVSFTSEDACLVDNQFNDVATSIRVERVNALSAHKSWVTNNENYVHFYPNPANTTLNIGWENFNEDEASVTINDSKNVMVYNRNFKNLKRTQVTTSGLAPGLYIIMIRTRSQIVRGRVMICN